MKARVWNAYASNNSGSYTIVGRLPSTEVAERVAQELREMINAHTAWLKAAGRKAPLAESPLAVFCRANGLTLADGASGSADWPEHTDDNRPRIGIAGTQLVVHHEYTLGLTPIFGEFLYKRGGRVEHEENHAHHPMVVTASFYWGWQEEAKARQAIELPKLIAKLTGEEGVLTQKAHLGYPAAWRIGVNDFDEAPFAACVVFYELIAGIASLRAEAEAHGCHLDLRIAEAHSETDPLAHFRPSTPPVPRFDVVVVDLGNDSTGVAYAFTDLTLHDRWEAYEEVQTAPPIVMAQSVAEPRASAIARVLEKAGARVELKRNDA